jgi:hypothetical protein
MRMLKASEFAAPQHEIADVAHRADNEVSASVVSVVCVPHA